MRVSYLFRMSTIGAQTLGIRCSINQLEDTSLFLGLDCERILSLRSLIGIVCNDISFSTVLLIRLLGVNATGDKLRNTRIAYFKVAIELATRNSYFHILCRIVLRISDSQRLNTSEFATRDLYLCSQTCGVLSNCDGCSSCRRTATIRIDSVLRCR